MIQKVRLIHKLICGKMWVELCFYILCDFVYFYFRKRKELEEEYETKERPRRKRCKRKKKVTE